MIEFTFALTASATHNKYVIIIVWDGLRPDAVTPQTTPNLYTLMKRGVQFKDHHSIFPTVTITNAVSLATGKSPGTTGFFGNTLWYPQATGYNMRSEKVDFHQPIFTDDDKILKALSNSGLTLKNTFFQAAKQQNISTAFIGNAGARFLFDPSLPDTNKNAPPSHSVHYLIDNKTPNPLDKNGALYKTVDDYYANYFFDEILTKQKPTLSVLWLADPDATAHEYGFATPNYYAALKQSDNILGQLQKKLQQLGITKNTNILVLSDHAQSAISDSLKQFPLRDITHKQVGIINKKKGYSVSGNIRVADLLTQAGFHAYDGEGCRFNPILAGIQINGKPRYPTQVDITGKICGKIGDKYITPSYVVPKKLSANTIIVATNSSSEYIYLPTHNKKLMKKLVDFLQNHKSFDTIFINTIYYPKLAGTFSLAEANLAHSIHAPDLIVGLHYDAHARIQNLPGTALCDYPNERGTHGSFSPVDIHSFFAAVGPDFRTRFQDHLPTSNMDIAPTVATILGFDFSDAEGRIIREALKNTKQNNTIKKHVIIAKKNNHYTARLHIKELNQDNKIYRYFDYAKVLPK